MTVLPCNVQGVEVREGFELCPPGDYVFEVTGTNLKPFNFSTGESGHWLDVEIKVVMGPGASTEYEGRNMKHSIAITSKTGGILKSFFVHCGITEDFIDNQCQGQLNDDWLIGRQFIGRVRHRPDKNDPDKKWHEVDRPRPCNQETLAKLQAPTAATAAPTPPPPSAHMAPPPAAAPAPPPAVAPVPPAPAAPPAPPAAAAPPPPAPPAPPAAGAGMPAPPPPASVLPGGK